MKDETCVLIGVLGVAALVAITIISVAWLCNWSYERVEIEAMKSGYEQRTLPGLSGVYWVKAGKVESK